MDILVVVGRVGSFETVDKLTEEELENVLSTQGASGECTKGKVRREEGLTRSSEAV